MMMKYESKYYADKDVAQMPMKEKEAERGVLFQLDQLEKHIAACHEATQRLCSRLEPVMDLAERAEAPNKLTGPIQVPERSAVGSRLGTAVRELDSLFSRLMEVCDRVQL